MTAGPFMGCDCGQEHPLGCTGHVDLDDGSRRPCKRAPIAGGRVCRSHGGAAPQVRRAAQRRLAEAEAARAISDVVVTPVDNPLDALADLAAEAVAWKGHLASMVAELRDQYRFVDEDPHGRRTEQLDARVALFERAMDRCQKYLADWVRLGFEERKARLDDARAQLVAVALAGALRELGVDPESPSTLAALDRWMPMLDGSPAPAPIEVTVIDDQEDRT